MATTDKRTIKKAAVLGSGIMGSRIACHFAGAGLQVILLDIVPDQAKQSNDKTLRNKIVNDSLQSAIKSKPSPVYSTEVISRISTGNFDDNLKDIATCDWVIEVVVESLEIKRALYERLEPIRKPGTIISSNTSGIPIQLLKEGRSLDFKKHFCGTHFFNPPRYLRLLEIIPTEDTDQEVIDFLLNYGDLYLGKTTVRAKDTPAFIANRIGVFGMMAIFKIMGEMEMTIDEIDALTGPLIGHPKSATYRTADVVGIDTLVKVANGIYENCPDDEKRSIFQIPAWLQKMVDNKWLGDKTGQGFFKKLKSGSGDKEILSLNLKTMEYGERQKVRFPGIDEVKQVDNLKQRIQLLLKLPDKAGQFYRRFHYELFSYISYRIPEISNELYAVDDAMKAGFGWELGAFETWDQLGTAQTAAEMKAAGCTVNTWIIEMLEDGNKSFYKPVEGKTFVYSPVQKQYIPSGQDASAFIILNNFGNNSIWNNNSCRILDLGDDVIAVQWNTKMNTIGGDVLAGINKAIELAENSYRGLVIANDGANFSAGANVGMIFMLAVEQEYDELDMAIRLFQNTMMRCRFSSIPVVIAPHGLALGGACEMSLHSDKVCAAAETYTGLVELGVGLIPGGGGTKEFSLRASDEMHEDEPQTITLKNRFLTIATAKVATSAFEAYHLGIYRKGHDEVVMNHDRRIGRAKQSVIDLSAGYVMQIPKKDILVLGQSGLGTLYAGINGMRRANYATDHDVTVAKKLAYVMCGGDLSEPTFVSEQYLLDIEREAFLSLCGEKKTLERIQNVIKGGKPLRN